jgi:hypothetical protein
MPYKNGDKMPYGKGAATKKPATAKKPMVKKKPKK